MGTVDGGEVELNILELHVEEEGGEKRPSFHIRYYQVSEQVANLFGIENSFYF